MVQSLSFDDLIPQQPQVAQGVKFDDLIPQTQANLGFMQNTANVQSEAGKGIVQGFQGMGNAMNPDQDQVPVQYDDGGNAYNSKGTLIQPQALPIQNAANIMGNVVRVGTSGVEGGLRTAGMSPRLAQDFTSLGTLAVPLAKEASNISLPEMMTNNSRNILTNNAGTSVAPALTISDAIKQNLLEQNPDIRTYAGEDLGQRISGAEQNAATNKDQAYQAANPVLAQATVPKTAATNFTDTLNGIANKYDPDLVPASKAVTKYANEFASDNTNSPVSLADYETLRQKLNNIPTTDSKTASLVGQAKGALDDHLNDMAAQGIINGDPSALKLITDARAKNAEWRSQFTGDQANNAIKGFIEKQGGIDSVAPETLLDQFTRVGQAGFDNVRAAKQVLGDDAAPILKQGYLNRVRSTSVDANGEIVPKKLQTSINTLLQKNPTLSKFIFSSEELEGLQGISNTAARYAKTGAQPGVIGKVVNKIPIASELFGPTIKARAQTKMMQNISNPRMQ